MTSAWSQLEQMLTCAICLDKFKNPRLLPCQHSFCGDACMEGLVDYARRQIKCPECRAEHRIPYQGVASLPSNVTLIRFLELHSRITGEEPEPVPTFLEKCSVCGEKVDGVQRCWHCEKKVCPECKSAHLDLLKREITRINNQSKRCFGKMQEFKEILERSEERLKVNYKQVKNDIENSCKRLIEDLQLKQKKLLDEVDLYVEQEEKTIEKLKISIVDELEILDSNTKLADDKISSTKYQWTDQELTEIKEIYVKSMEFVRLFDPEIGDFNRKIRFNLIPEFENLRRRIIEIGELKFTESAASLISSSLQYCNATGHVALELYNTASAQSASNNNNNNNSMISSASAGGYGLSQSNSNSNLGISGNCSSNSAAAAMLELPSIQNALMRSQSDHRLASQFQQRLKLQQQELQRERQQDFSGKSSNNGTNGARYGGNRDYETDALRSRYAPTPRGSGAGSKQDYGLSNDLLRDWPRPSDSDTGSDMFGAGSSSIQFKSAFMRRKEKERQQLGYGYGTNNDDDDDLTSEASYGAASGRNVRFYGDNQDRGNDNNQQAKQISKLFDVKECEHSPLSGVPKLEEAPHFNCRLHQMGAKAIVNKKREEEEGQRDKDLVESARQVMNKAKERRAQRQQSEDEIEKQKRANQQQSAGDMEPIVSRTRAASPPAPPTDDLGTGMVEFEPEDLPAQLPTPTTDLNSSTSTVIDAEAARSRLATDSNSSTPTTITTTPATTATTTTPLSSAGNRRGLYGAAVTEKSKRQLSNAIQEAAAYTRRRTTGASSSNEGDQTPDTSSSSPAASSGRVKKSLRSSGRSQSSRNNSIDESGSSTGTTRRRRLVRADSSAPNSPTSTSNSTSTNKQTTSDNNSPTTVGSTTGSSSLTNNPLASVAGVTSQRSSGNHSSPLSSGPVSGSVESKNYSTGSGGHGGDLGETSSSSLTASQQPARSSAYSYSSRSTVAADLASATTDSEEQQRDRLISKTLTSSRVTPTSGYSASSRRRATRDSSDSTDNDDDDDDDDDDDQDDDEQDNEQDNQHGSGKNSSNRRSRELLPSAVNKLLDRSAQIRRDSQEQRNRGDSPKRSLGSSTSTSASSRDRAGDHYPTTSSKDSSVPLSSQRQTQSSFYSPSTSLSGAASTVASRRFAYQRSTSIRDSQQQNNDNDDTNNSNNSIYTTASSSGSHIVSSRRKSSLDDDLDTNIVSGTMRRSSGNSSDRTLISSFDRPSAYTSSSAGSSSRRDSGANDSIGRYQSRFLSRSRTSAALQSSASSRSQESNNSTSARDTVVGIHDLDLDNNNNNSASSSNPRSYLSSRDRFMQSASVVSGPGSGSQSGISNTSSNLYNSSSSSVPGSHSSTRAAASAVTKSALPMGCLSQFRHNLPPTPPKATNYSSSNIRDNGSPFLDFNDDDDDDQYSAYFPTVGLKTHSEYLRNKFNSQRRSSSISSTSSALIRSRSSHATFDNEDSNEDEVAHEDYEANNNNNRSSKGNEPHQQQSTDDDDQANNGNNHRGSRRTGRRSPQASSSGGGLNSRRSSTSTIDYSIGKTVYGCKQGMLFKFGSRGSEAGNFTWPRGVASGQGGSLVGEIVVADSSNHRVQIFDLKGKFLNEFGSYGSEDGQFDCLAGVAINRVNKSYIVSDRYNHRLQVFDFQGKFVRTFGSYGKEAGKFNLPWGVACDTSGLIYVCDKENHRIQVFDIDGTYLNKFGSSGNQAGQLQHPHYIAVGQSKIVVTDTNNHRVQVFDLSGRLISSLGREGSLDGQFKFPRGVAMDEHGMVIVGDSGNNRLQIFNPDGVFIKSIGTWGSSDGEFKGIEGVAVDSNNNILVCDRENHRIQVF